MKYFPFLFLVFPTMVVAQQEPTYSREWTSIEIVLSVGLLIFSLILIGIEALIIIKAKTTWAPTNIIKVIGLTLIVTFSALLVVAGYDQDQMGPVIGLLGVIAGYLLGTNEQAKTPGGQLNQGQG